MTFFFGWGGRGGRRIAFFNVFINIIHIIWVFNKSLESLKCFKPVLSQLLIKKWYFPLYGSLAYKCYQYLVADLINWIMNLFFQIQNLQLLILYMDGLYYIATFNLFFFFCLLDLCSLHMHMFLSDQLIALFYHHLNLKQSY